jgi:hypothetical protein
VIVPATELFRADTEYQRTTMTGTADKAAPAKLSNPTISIMTRMERPNI